VALDVRRAQRHILALDAATVGIDFTAGWLVWVTTGMCARRPGPQGQRGAISKSGVTPLGQLDTPKPFEAETPELIKELRR